MKAYFTQPWLMTAKTMLGFEDLLSKELEGIGAKDIQILNRAVSFKGDLALMYRANFELRTALKVLVQIEQFKAKNPDELYDKVKRMPWETLMEVSDTFAIDPVVYSKDFKHSHFAGLRMKDAIVDRFREAGGERPSIDLIDPVFRLNLHIDNQLVNISLDSSGESLHRRGYRLHGLAAPLSEVLAAGMIMRSGWDGDSHFKDPMCGSGTLLVEAAMIGANIPPQANRRDFGFMHWPNFDPNLFNQIKKNAFGQKRDLAFTILGADIDADHVTAAKENIAAANLGIDIKVDQADFLGSEAPFDSGTLMMNPPYGERMSSEDLAAFYKEIGNTLKQKYKGYKAWIISSDMAAMKFVGLKPSVKVRMLNGALECSFRRFDIFSGSYKELKSTQNEMS